MADLTRVTIPIPPRATVREALRVAGAGLREHCRRTKWRTWQPGELLYPRFRLVTQATDRVVYEVVG